MVNIPNYNFINYDFLKIKYFLFVNDLRIYKINNISPDPLSLYKSSIFFSPYKKNDTENNANNSSKCTTKADSKYAG